MQFNSIVNCIQTRRILNRLCTNPPVLYHAIGIVIKRFYLTNLC